MFRVTRARQHYLNTITWCCGLDVHAKTVLACLMTPGQKQIRTFVTMTDVGEALQVDLCRSSACGVTWADEKEFHPASLN
jgi:hypothetical protein